MKQIIEIQREIAAARFPILTTERLNIGSREEFGKYSAIITLWWHGLSSGLAAPSKLTRDSLLIQLEVANQRDCISLVHKTKPDGRLLLELSFRLSYSWAPDFQAELERFETARKRVPSGWGSHPGIETAVVFSGSFAHRNPYLSIYKAHDDRPFALVAERLAVTSSRSRSENQHG